MGVWNLNIERDSRHQSFEGENRGIVGYFLNKFASEYQNIDARKTVLNSFKEKIVNLLETSLSD